ncbi:MAG: TolC family protein [bacterium]|nr:TolC family protein [bacterium]
MKPTLLLVIILATCANTYSQTKPTKSADSLAFSLQQAIDYALANNPNFKNAVADVAFAQQQVKEVKSIGIPQAKINIQMQDAIQKQVFVFPVNGVPTPIRIGNKYTTQAALNVTWLMLDGSYFIGLKAASEFTEMSKKLAYKSELDLRTDVSKTYFMALITLENIKLVGNSYNTVNSLYTQTAALNREGLAEALDVDRLQLQLNNIKISQHKLDDQYQIILALLKSKMGMNPEQPMKLTDDINLVNDKYTLADTSNLKYTNRAEYQVLQQQLLLNKFDIKRYQYGKYPSLASAFTYQQSTFGETLNYSKWYDNYFLAVQLSIPVFSGFGNDAKIQKARITQIKTENSIANVENLLTLEVFQAKQKYLRAEEYVLQQKENLALADKIVKITSIKYKEGVGSNLELTTATQDQKTAQTNYLNALYDLIIAKIDYNSAMGQPTKFN